MRWRYSSHLMSNTDQSRIGTRPGSALFLALHVKPTPMKTLWFTGCFFCVWECRKARSLFFWAPSKVATVPLNLLCSSLPLSQTVVLQLGLVGSVFIIILNSATTMSHFNHRGRLCCSISGWSFTISHGNDGLISYQWPALGSGPGHERLPLWMLTRCNSHILSGYCAQNGLRAETTAGPWERTVQMKTRSCLKCGRMGTWALIIIYLARGEMSRNG